MEQTLRKLAIKLETSGTAEPIETTKLYKGGYAFVWLLVFVPVTANRSSETTPLCTVHGVITDGLGNRRRLGARRYNMNYSGTQSIDGFKYLRFERMLPKPLTSAIGELDLVFNYSEFTQDEKLAARLPSSTYKTQVEEGDVSDDEIEPEITEDELALSQINSNTLNIALLQGETSDLDDLTQDHEQRLTIAESDIINLGQNKIDKVEKGAANGVATLDSSGKVTANQIDTITVESIPLTDIFDLFT